MSICTKHTIFCVKISITSFLLLQVPWFPSVLKQHTNWKTSPTAVFADGNTHTHTKHCQLPTTPPRPRTSPWVLRSLAWHAGELCGRRRRGGFLKFAGGGGLSSKEMIIETLVRFEWVSNQLTRFFRCMMCNYVVYIEDELRSYLQLYSGGFDFHTIAT